MPHPLSTIRKESDCLTSLPCDIDIIYSRAALMTLGNCASFAKSLGEVEELEGSSPFATGTAPGELDVNKQLDTLDTHNGVVTSCMGMNNNTSAHTASRTDAHGEKIVFPNSAALMHQQALPARWQATSAATAPAPEKTLGLKRQLSSVIDDDLQRARAEAIRAKLRLAHMLPGSPADTKLSPISNILLRRSEASRCMAGRVASPWLNGARLK